MSEGGSPSTIGKYEILATLGEGGMGIVYKGRDPFLDRIVAVKTIRVEDPERETELLKRLTLEAKSAARLQHPNIVTIYEFGVDNGLPFLAMEFVEGANLARLIADHAALSLDVRLDLVVQLANALAYAHELGVYHRDIKPSNICLTRKGAPKLLDFGLARFDDTRLTRTGLTSGTLAYISPERMQGESGPSDDVFAIGAVAYEILTGERAFPGRTYGEIVRNMLSGEFPLPASSVAKLPRELDAVLARATALAKADRFQSAADLARAIDHFRFSPVYAAARQNDVVDDSLATVMLNAVTANPYSAPDIYDPSQEQFVPTTPVEPLRIPDAARLTPKSAAKSGDSILFQETVVDKKIATPHAAKPSPPSGATASTKPIKAQHDLTGPTAPVRRMEEPPPGTQTVATVIGTIRMALTRPFVAPQQPGEAAPAPLLPKRLAISLGALVVALLATPLVLNLAGPFGFAVLFIAAATAWLFALRERAALALPTVLLIALLLRIVTWVHAPAPWSEVARYADDGRVAATWTNPYEPAENRTPAVEGTHAEIMLAGWALTNTGLGGWRLLLAIVELLIVGMLFSRTGSRGALAYATCPAVIFESSWNANVQIVAAALLLAVMLLARRQRTASAGALIGAAGGFSLASLAALPVARRFSDGSFRMLFAAALTFLPGFFFFASTDAPVFSRIAGAELPFFSLLATSIADLIVPYGVTAKAKALLAERGLALDELFTVSLESVIGGTVVVIALLIVLSIVARRSRSVDAALTNAVGLMLLFSGAPHPWIWLLIAPAAIVADQTVWLLIVLSAQLLYIGVGGLPLMATVYALPFLVVFALKHQKERAVRMGLVFGS